MALDMSERARYSQQIKLSEIGLAGQIKLKQARVLCIGAGGLASSLLLYLAAAGVGTIGIVDDDKIELSNLQRQILYNTNHIGSKKIEVASQVIADLNPELDILSYPVRLNTTNAQELISLYDIVVDCSDNFATRYIVNDICYSLNKPFVFASIFQFKGQCSLFTGNRGPCYRCLFPMHSVSTILPDCSEGGVLGVLPGILGVIQATEALKYLLNLGELLTGRLLTVNILTMQFREFKISRDPECQVCQSDDQKKVAYGAANDIISVEELRKQLEKDNNLTLLDVRSLEEREEYHIGGEIIPLPELASRLAELNPLDNIVVYCHLGQRSLYAVELLKKAKFHSVKSLAGGLKAWQNQSF
jgi:molybdopterin/thiamine biosynthesis adenylyltransferase/rhodanese-related sulfurtransferase